MESTNMLENDANRERIECLVRQGFTQSLAENVLLARSAEHLPLTVWIVDNSASMIKKDGRRIVDTESSDDVRISPCSRWEELRETVTYHAQLAALLEAPTRFRILNGSDRQLYQQELSIAERGSEWIEDDIEHFIDNFAQVRPKGATPLTDHLQKIYHSLTHIEGKIVLVIATDGVATDDLGFVSPSVNRAFISALKLLQSKARIVVRVCTNDEKILNYYKKLKEMELPIEVLDDYMDEAKEIYQCNPWLTYSLSLHRCREMGISCLPTLRFLNWLDERPLARKEIDEVLKRTLGLIDSSDDSTIQLSSQSEDDWRDFCAGLQRQQEVVALKYEENDDDKLKALFPWNPIQKRTTHWINIPSLKLHGRQTTLYDYMKLLIIPIVLLAIYLKTKY